MRWACSIAGCIPLSLAFNAIVTLPDPHTFGPAGHLFLATLEIFFRSPVPVTAAAIAQSCLAFLPAVAGAVTGAWPGRSVRAPG